MPTKLWSLAVSVNPIMFPTYMPQNRPPTSNVHRFLLSSCTRPGRKKNQKLKNFIRFLIFFFFFLFSAFWRLAPLRHIVTQNNSRGGSVKSSVGTTMAEPKGSKRKLRESQRNIQMSLKNITKPTRQIPKSLCPYYS